MFCAIHCDGIDCSKEAENLGSWKTVVQLYFVCDWKPGRFRVSANQVSNYCFLDQRKSQTSLPKSVLNEFSKRKDVSKLDLYYSLNTVLSFLNEFVSKTLHNGLRGIHLYDSVDADGFEINALKIAVSLGRVCMFLCKNLVHHLQLFPNYRFQSTKEARLESQMRVEILLERLRNCLEISWSTYPFSQS